jgi:hypothetical protein
MKSSIRELIGATAVIALLLGGATAGVSAITPAYAAQDIRAVVSVCDWEDLEWGEMTGAERRQWAVLGWTQMLWESDDDSAYPASAFKDWEDLNVNEQAAAWSLGYTPRSWDSEDICQ